MSGEHHKYFREVKCQHCSYEMRANVITQPFHRTINYCNNILFNFFPTTFSYDEFLFHFGF